MLPQQWSYLPSEAPPCLGTEWVGLGSIGLGVWVDILKYVSFRVQIKNKGLYIYNFIYIVSISRDHFISGGLLLRNPTNQPTSLQVVKIPNMFHVLLSLPGEVGALSEIWAGPLGHWTRGWQHVFGRFGGTGYCSRCLISGELFDGYFRKEAFAIDMGIFMDIYQLANFLAMMCFNSQGWMEPLTCVMSSIFRILPFWRYPIWTHDPYPCSLWLARELGRGQVDPMLPWTASNTWKQVTIKHFVSTILPNYNNNHGISYLQSSSQYIHQIVIV